MGRVVAPVHLIRQSVVLEPELLQQSSIVMYIPGIVATKVYLCDDSDLYLPILYKLAMPTVESIITLSTTFLD